MAGGGQRGEIGDGGASHEGAATTGGQGQSIEQPAERNLFEDGGDRGSCEESGVLVPRGGQPVGRQRGGERATNHESEKARPGDTHGGG